MSMKANVLVGGVAAAGLGALGGFAAALLRTQARAGDSQAGPGRPTGSTGPARETTAAPRENGGRLDDPARA